MNEYISREAMLKNLTADLEHHSDECDPRTVLVMQRFIKYVEDFPATDVQPVDRWISVKDRLPEENILVLCYARSTTGEGNDYFLGALAHGEFWFLKVNDIGHVSCPVLHWEVTHWQPLPESPKDGATNG